MIELVKLGASNSMDDFQNFLRRHLRKDAEFREEYFRLGPLYGVIEQVIRRRHELRLTQEQLANRMGRQQPAIARLEAARTWPSLSFLQEVAEALDLKLSIRFEPKDLRGEAAATEASVRRRPAKLKT